MRLILTVFICCFVSISGLRAGIIPDAALKEEYQLKRQQVRELNEKSKELYITNPQEAYHTALKAYDLAITSADELGKAFALMRMGQMFFIEMEYFKAADYFWDAARRFERISESEGLCESLIWIGDVNRKKKNFSDAEVFYQLAYTITKSIKRPEFVSRIYNRIGDLYRYKNELDKAEWYYLQAIEINKSNRLNLEMANDFNNMGTIMLLRKMHNLAENYYLKGIEIGKTYNNPYNLTENLLGLACIDTANGNYTRALHYLQEAKAIGEKYHYRDELQHIYKLYSVIYEKQGDYKQAYKTMLDYQTIHSSMGVESAVKTNQHINALQNLRYKDQRIYLQQTNLKRNQTYQHYLAIGIILLTIGGIYLIYVSFNSRSLMRRYKQQTHELREIRVSASNQLNMGHDAELLRDKMIAIISHDIRSPLSNTLKLLELKVINKSHQEDAMLLEMYAGLKYSYQLLDNMLLWAKNNMDGIKPNFAIHDLHTLIKSELDNFQLIAKSKQVNFVNEVGEGMKIYADAELTRGIIRNLVLNAIKYTPQGRNVYLRSRRNGDLCEIIVEDEGKGMDSETVKSLLQKVIQTSQIGTNHEEGMGLGMMIIKEFVKKNRGVFTIQSTPGAGSVFKCALKLI